MDKSCRRLERAKLHSSTEKAWQSYAHAQEAHISETDALADRAKTDKGLWSMFRANITASDVHSQAFHAYMTNKAAYDALPVRA